VGKGGIALGHAMGMTRPGTAGGGTQARNAGPSRAHKAPPCCAPQAELAAALATELMPHALLWPDLLLRRLLEAGLQHRQAGTGGAWARAGRGAEQHCMV